MTVKAGIDYVFAREITYAGAEGIGKGCLVGTHNILLQFPTRTNQGMGRTMISKRWLIDDKPVREALTETLNDPDLTSGDLDRTLRRLGEKVSGSLLIDFAVVRRLKIKSSLLSRGIYTSEKSSGSGWKGFPLKKEDVKAFGIFYAGHPAAMGLQQSEMKIDYFLGIIRVELFFRGCRTLKDRRGHLRSLKDRLSNMGFSVAQVGPANFIQHACLMAVFISGSEAGVRRLLDKTEKLMYNPEWELVSLEKDILGDNEILPYWEQL